MGAPALLAVALTAAGAQESAAPLEQPIATADGTALSVPQADSPLIRGDAAWERRGDGGRDGSAAAEPVGAAVAAYEEALRADPGSLEAAWKLMRALWFQGEYATPAVAPNGSSGRPAAATDAGAVDAAKQRVFGRGREVGEAAFARLAQRSGRNLAELEPAAVATALRAVPEAAPIYFWAAVNWGLWGEVYGKLAAARQGVAGRIRDYTQVVIALDPRYEQAGGHRVLGRLHARAPSIPFVTGWIDRDTAIEELRRAVALAPDSSFNRLYLAEALAEHRPGDVATRAEIRALAEVVAQGSSQVDGEVERRRNAIAASRLLR